MPRMLRAIVILASMLAIFSALCLAQAAKPKYDPATEVHFAKATVVDIKLIPENGKSDQHLIVKVGEQTYEVCLCPKSFVDTLGLDFKTGDQLEITGSKVKTDSGEVILAREIVKGNNTLTLRDKKGEPVWTWLK
ncbi:MAG TPA: hypothetical protein VK473_09470 [Terriglobales bacterium]|nr:hypothetical protein [Terriglobales bacterium]